MHFRYLCVYISGIKLGESFCSIVYILKYEIQYMEYRPFNLMAIYSYTDDLSEFTESFILKEIGFCSN